MATNLLAVAATRDAVSSTFAVAAGAPLTVSLKGATNEALCRLDKSDDTGAWVSTGLTLSAEGPTRTIVGAGSYRLVRLGGTCGAFYD